MKKIEFLLPVVTLCFVGSLGLSVEERRAHLKVNKATCFRETGVSPVSIENYNKGQMPENDDKFGCYGACLLTKVGAMNAEGVIDIEVSRKILVNDIPNEKIEELVNSCALLSGNSTCEIGFKILKCLLERRNFQL